MPVKNATRRDPRVHVAYLTTSSQGWSMMEQGQVKEGKMTFHLKQFMRRSFDVGNNNNLEIREFERQLELPDYNTMLMKVSWGKLVSFQILKNIGNQNQNKTLGKNRNNLWLQDHYLLVRRLYFWNGSTSRLKEIFSIVNLFQIRAETAYDTETYTATYKRVY